MSYLPNRASNERSRPVGKGTLSPRVASRVFDTGSASIGPRETENREENLSAAFHHLPCVSIRSFVLTEIWRSFHFNRGLNVEKMELETRDACLGNGIRDDRWRRHAFGR